MQPCKLIYGITIATLLLIKSFLAVAQPALGLTDNAISSGEWQYALPGASSPRVYMRMGGLTVNASPDIYLEDHTVGFGQSVWGILPSYGFEANSEILGIVRALNPEVIDISNIRSGQTIIIPAIGNDDLVAGSSFIYTDAAPIASFQAVSNEISTNIQLTSGIVFGSAVFGNSNPYVEINDFLNIVSAVTDSISAETLSLISTQAGIYQDIATYMGQPPPEVLQGFITSKPGIFAEFESIGSTEILNDAWSAARATLRLVTEAITHDLPNHRSVSVTTLDNTGEDRCQLTVWHAPKSSYLLNRLDTDKRRLRRVSSPANGSVPVSVRIFWAEWDGNIASEYFDTSIYSGSTAKAIDIIVSGGSDCE